MEFCHDGAQERRLGGMDGAGDFCDKFGANIAIFVAHRVTIEHRRIGGLGSVDILGHAAPRQFDRIAELV
jgi:hypothetical protein